MTERKVKLEKPFPEEDLGFGKMFSNLKIPQIELTTPFVVEDCISMFGKDMNIPIIEVNSHRNIIKKYIL